MSHFSFQIFLGITVENDNQRKKSALHALFIEIVDRKICFQMTANVSV